MLRLEISLIWLELDDSLFLGKLDGVAGNHVVLEVEQVSVCPARGFQRMHDLGISDSNAVTVCVNFWNENATVLSTWDEKAKVVDDF